MALIDRVAFGVLRLSEGFGQILHSKAALLITTFTEVLTDAHVDLCFDLAPTPKRQTTSML